MDSKNNLTETSNVIQERDEVIAALKRENEKLKKEWVKIPPLLSKPATELLFWYYGMRVEVEKELNHQNTSIEFQYLFNDKKFQKKTHLFCEKLGITGWFYGIADSKANKVHIFKNKDIDPDEIDQPFFFHPGDCDTSNLGRENYNCVLDLMYEADEEFMKLNAEKAYQTPYFLQNTPPLTSRYSDPLLPIEKYMRDKERINFLHCYTGEVLFYLYTYRFLLKIIKNQGFNQFIQLDSVKIKNSRTASFQLWDLKHWEEAGFENIPELRWLKIINKKAGTNRYASGKYFDKLVDKWKMFIRSKEKIEAGVDCDFIKNEWKNLGLKSDLSNPDGIKNSPWLRSRNSLLSYAVHLGLSLKGVNPKFKMEVFETLSPSYKNTMGEVLETLELEDNKEKEDILYRLIQVHLGQKQSEQGDWEFDEKKFKDTPENKEWIHHFIMLVFYLSFIENKKSVSISTSGLLKELHKKSRFPVFQTYFQVAWAKDNTPIEHHYIPLHKSIRYPYEINLPKRDIQQKGVTKSPFVIMGCVLVDPIWKLSKNFHITEERKYFMFQENIRLSPEYKLRLNLIQDFLKLMAAPLIDSFFYGKLKEDEVKLKSKNEQHQFQAHEIKDIISSIDEKNPGYVLELIRLYLNVIYGSRELIVESFTDLNKGEQTIKQLPKEFKIDLDKNTIEDIINKAISIACSIQAISEDNSVFDKEYHRFPIDETEFNKRVNKDLIRTVKIKFSKEMTLTPLKKEWFVDKKDARGFYFMMAIVCGIRNALEHRKKNTEIIISNIPNHMAFGHCIVIKNRLKNNYKRTVRKFNFGSTALSLVYYCKGMLEISFEKKQEQKSLLHTLNDADLSQYIFKAEEGDDHNTYIPLIT